MELGIPIKTTDGVIFLWGSPNQAFLETNPKAPAVKVIFGWSRPTATQSNSGTKLTVVVVMITFEVQFLLMTGDIYFLEIPTPTQVEKKVSGTKEHKIFGLLKSIRMAPKFGTKPSGSGNDICYDVAHTADGDIYLEVIQILAFQEIRLKTVVVKTISLLKSMKMVTSFGTDLMVGM